jgi:hypothetical protein
MEAVALLGFVIAVGIAAQRWGYDSRDRPRSHEHELALCGVSWEELTDAWNIEAVLAELQAILAERRLA